MLWCVLVVFMDVWRLWQDTITSGHLVGQKYWVNCPKTDCVHWSSYWQRLPDSHGGTGRSSFLQPTVPDIFLPMARPAQDTTQSTHSDSIIAQKPRRTTGPGPGTDQPKYLWCDGDNNREPGVAWSVCSSKAKQPDGVINNLPARLGKPSSSDWPGHARH